MEDVLEIGTNYENNIIIKISKQKARHLLKDLDIHYKQRGIFLYEDTNEVYKFLRGHLENGNNIK